MYAILRKVRPLKWSGPLELFFYDAFICEKRFLYFLAAMSNSSMICFRNDSGLITSAADPNPMIVDTNFFGLFTIYMEDLSY